MFNSTDAHPPKGVVEISGASEVGKTSILSAMLFGLFTLDLEGAERAIDVLVWGVLFMVLIGVAAGIIVPLLVGLVFLGRLDIEFLFIPTAMGFGATAGLVVMVQFAMEFNQWGCWIGMGLGIGFGIGITVVMILDVWRGRGKVNPTTSNDSRTES